MSWEAHVKKIVIPGLSNRARTLRQITPYLDPSFRKQYATSIFKGKLNFAADAWGGVSQNRVAKATLGSKFSKKSTPWREKELGWLTIRQDIDLATSTLTHKVIHQQIPEELSLKIPINQTNPRLKEAAKLATKPKYLNKNKWTSSSFRGHAHLFNTLPHRLTALTLILVGSQNN